MNIAISAERFSRTGTHVPLADDNERLRAENLALKGRISELESLLVRSAIRIPPEWRLTGAEEAIVHMLYVGGADYTPASRLIRAVQNLGGTSGSPCAIAVHCSRIRQKFPQGCGIETAPRRLSKAFAEPAYRLNVHAIAWLYTFQMDVFS